MKLTKRHTASWRVPIGNSGILDFCLGLLAVEGIRPTLRIQMLRIVGNSCADTGELLKFDPATGSEKADRIQADGMV